MKIRIEPSAPSGQVKAPPSKSMAHRLLICAGLADGTSRVRGITFSQDIHATCDCLAALGANMRPVSDDPETGILEISGADPVRSSDAVMHCRESGSTLRFFIPVAALSGSTMTMTGEGRLLSRPMSVYEDIFREKGLFLERDADSITVRGSLTGGTYNIDASVSSQFVSGMLLALPLASEDSTIHLVPPVESRSYIGMTIAAMKEFGVQAVWKDDTTIFIPGGQKYAARDVTVEGDWSNAAFLLAIGADVRGLEMNSLQGDRVCAEYFRALDETKAELDITDCPDLGPVLMAHAALRHGAKLTGTRRLKYKESDRGEAMKEELARFGVKVTIEDNSITIENPLTEGAHTPSSELEGHNDHRIVMALSVLCLHTGGIINGAEAVSKSYPDYFDRLRDLGISVSAVDD